MIVPKEKALHKEVIPGVQQIHYIDKGSGAGAVSLGMVILQPGAVLRQHIHKVEDAMLVIEGRGVMMDNGVEYPIEEGMGLLAPANTLHGLKNNSDKPLKIVYTWPSVEVERFFP
ncbi:MAG: cupin domain-containing protein [Clostridia bacterium]|jgi:quercetin dioxygenase-like cupin family protein|nr:cupin domain-containing protein [Clostridia bacterium]